MPEIFAAAAGSIFLDLGLTLHKPTRRLTILQEAHQKSRDAGVVDRTIDVIYVEAVYSPPIAECSRCHIWGRHAHEGFRWRRVSDVPQNDVPVRIRVGRQLYKCTLCAQIFPAPNPPALLEHNKATRRLASEAKAWYSVDGFAGAARRLHISEQMARSLARELTVLEGREGVARVGIDTMRVGKRKLVVLVDLDHPKGSEVVDIGYYSSKKPGLLNRGSRMGAPGPASPAADAESVMAAGRVPEPQLRDEIDRMVALNPIRVAVVDLDRQLQDAIGAAAPWVELVIDVWHVHAALRAAARQRLAPCFADEPRQKAKAIINGIVAHPLDVDPEVEEVRRYWAQQKPEVAEILELIAIVHAIYDASTSCEALIALEDLVTKARGTGLGRFAKAVDRSRGPILNYFNHRLTNGATESWNREIRAIIAHARGCSRETLLMRLKGRSRPNPHFSTSPGRALVRAIGRLRAARRP